MTTRLKGLVVTFERDIREDDAEGIIEAIRHIRGVLAVANVPTNVDDYIIEARVRNDIERRIFDALRRDK